MTEQDKLSIRTLSDAVAVPLRAIVEGPVEVDGLVEAAYVTVSQGGHAWAILLNDEAIGLGTLTSQGELMLYLRPGYRRCGYGSIALSNLARRAFEAGFSHVYARARVDSPGSALAKRCGFYVTSTTGSEELLELSRLAKS